MIVPAAAEARIDVGRFEILVGHLEAMIPQAVFARPHLLRLLPADDPILMQAGIAQPLEVVERDLRPARQVAEAAGVVGQHHRVVGVGVLEEVEDPFLFHQPRGKLKIRLVILHAIVAGIERALNLGLIVIAGQHGGENVGDRSDAERCGSASGCGA